jgi:hypothetical protein
MKKKNDKIKILFSKWYFNYYELEEQKELYNEYNSKFNEKINVLNSNSNSNSTNISNSKDIILNNFNKNIPNFNNNNNNNNNNNILNKDIDLEDYEQEYMKKIIKKLKLKCHPDKTDNKELHELIKEINEAEKNKDYSFILLCANELNIQELYSDFSIIENFFKKFYKIKLIKEDEIKNSCAWIWATEKNEEIKRKVEEFIISKLKKNNY